MQFIHQMNDPSPAFNPLVQFEMQLRRMLDDHTPRQQKLEVGTPCVQLGNNPLALLFRSDHGHVNVRVLEVRGDVHLLNGHQLRVKMDLASEQVAQFPPEEFVDAFESMFGHA